MIKIEPQMLQIVLEAIHDLHIQEQIVDRDVLPELTGLNLGGIDRCVSLLLEQGLIRRVPTRLIIPIIPPPPHQAQGKHLLPRGRGQN